MTSRVTIPHGRGSIELELPSETLLGCVGPEPAGRSEPPSTIVRRALDHPVGAARLPQLAGSAPCCVTLASPPVATVAGPPRTGGERR